jgi:hypothetical protein
LGLTAIYQLVLYNSDGERLAIIDDYRSLQFGHTVNDAGFFVLQISATDDKRTLFDRDYILEVQRKIPGYLDWYREFIGHCEDFESVYYGNGNTQYVVAGSGLKGLLGRVVVGYEEGTSEAAKNTNAESAMKEYVRENRAGLATVANGREATSKLDTFSVEADSGAGAVWAGDRAGKNLLKTLQDIANFSNIDFDVITDPTSGIGYYLFKTYEDQVGEDRTVVGLDSSTGLNAAGNAPHIFSLERGNLGYARVVEKHKKEFNRVFVFGRDPTTGLTLIRVRNRESAISDDYLSLREAMRGGGSQASADEMDKLGDEYLVQYQTKTGFTFNPVDQPSSLYGLHYSVGDKITARVDDTEYNQRLVRVQITVSGSNKGESNKTYEFADMP